VSPPRTPGEIAAAGAAAVAHIEPTQQARDYCVPLFAPALAAMRGLGEEEEKEGAA
jgi:hypothetical protein